MKPILALSLLALALGGTYAATASGLRLPEGLHNAVKAAADSTEAKLFRVDSDGGDSEGHRQSGGQGCGGDDEDDDDEGGAACNGAANPAPAGAATPPNNGLFGDGKAPIVKTN
jgi:hypothetical protein